MDGLGGVQKKRRGPSAAECPGSLARDVPRFSDAAGNCSARTVKDEFDRAVELVPQPIGQF